VDPRPPVLSAGGLERSRAAVADSPTNVQDVTETVTGRTPGAAPDRNGTVAAEQRTLVCAHRGASRRLPDNSPQAFEAAIASGCELIETDVRADRRGRLVLAHERVRVAAANARDPERPRSRARTSTRPRAAGPTQTIVADPTPLQKLLELARGRIGLDLEIKEARVVPALLDAVADWSGPLVLTSFGPDAIRAVHEQDPSRTTGLIAGPMHIGNPVTDAIVCGADLLVLNERRATAKLLGSPRLPVWVWTINQPARLTRWLAEPSVACVITDDPATAVAVRDRLPG
jgi:glycerophosphoryl diester phosphodiesterase